MFLHQEIWGYCKACERERCLVCEPICQCQINKRKKKDSHGSPAFFSPKEERVKEGKIASSIRK